MTSGTMTRTTALTTPTTSSPSTEGGGGADGVTAWEKPRARSPRPLAVEPLLRHNING
jgi:hypothetical protein